MSTQLSEKEARAAVVLQNYARFLPLVADGKEVTLPESTLLLLDLTAEDFPLGIPTAHKYRNRKTEPWVVEKGIRVKAEALKSVIADRLPDLNAPEPEIEYAPPAYLKSDQKGDEEIVILPPEEEGDE